MMKISTASTLASWVPVVLRCLKQFGIDEGQALKRASIRPDKLLQADANSFGALGFTMLASPTFKDALNHLKRFAPVASTVVRFNVIDHQNLTEI